MSAAVKNLSTLIARADDRSQFESNCAVWIGTSSVWPSMAI